MKADAEVAGGGSDNVARVGWVIFAVMLCLLAGFLFAVSAKTGRDGRLLAKEGAAIDAFVIAKDTSTSYQRRNSSTYYSLLLAYTPPGMERVEVQQSVSHGRYDAVDVGDRIKIRFVPSQPEVHEFAPGETAAAAETGRWQAAGLLLAAIGAAIWSWRPWRKTARV